MLKENKNNQPRLLGEQSGLAKATSSATQVKNLEPFLSNRADARSRSKQRLKILWLRFGERVVLIRWLHSGQRLEETVPFQRARHRRAELEAQGAVVYWSERLVHHG